LHAALAEGHVVRLPRTPTIADGLAARQRSVAVLSGGNVDRALLSSLH
jgi:threonine dehydratase